LENTLLIKCLASLIRSEILYMTLSPLQPLFSSKLVDLNKPFTKKLYIYDFDGTLFDNKTQTAFPALVAHVRQKSQKGHPVFVVSNALHVYLKKCFSLMQLESKHWFDELQNKVPDFQQNIEMTRKLLSDKVDFVVGIDNHYFELKSILDHVTASNFLERKKKWKELYAQTNHPALYTLDQTLGQYADVSISKDSARHYVNQLFSTSGGNAHHLSELQNVFLALFRSQYKPNANRTIEGIELAQKHGLIQNLQKIVVVGDNPQTDGGLALELMRKLKLPVSFLYADETIFKNTDDLKKVRTLDIGQKIKATTVEEFLLKLKSVSKQASNQFLVIQEEKSLGKALKSFWEKAYAS
jgi:hypothetical protein